MKIYTIRDLLFFIRTGCEVENKDITSKMKIAIKEFQWLLDCSENCEGSEREEYIEKALDLYEQDCSK